MTIRNFLAAMVIITAATGTHALAETADADDACANLDTDLTDQRAGKYADLITDTFSKDLEPSERFLPADVDVYGFMEIGDWSAVQGDIPTADSALFLFEKVDGKKQYKDVWGGLIEPSDESELIEWAEAAGAPQGIAACFAQQMTVADAISPYGFTVDLSFSTKAQARLTDLGEEIIVSASYYADPSPEGEKFADDVGRIDLGSKEVQAPAESGIVQVTGDGVDEDKLQWTDGDIGVNVNVFTARVSGDLNLISCDLIDGPLKDIIRAMPVAMNCALIEENIETVLRP